MSQETPLADVAKKIVVYRIPGMDRADVRRGVEYAAGLTMDIYYPTESRGEAPLPAVVFVLGYSDLGAEKIFGCKVKDVGAYVSWAQLAAASGLAAITYTTREPVADAHAVLEYVRKSSEALRIDANRIGVWSCSGNVPTALSVLIGDGSIRCAALCYGIMFDRQGSSGVSEAAKQWGFANPCVGKSADDLPRNVPLFVARAGQDQTPRLNELMDDFVAQALGRNLPLTLANHPDGPHAFDLFHDSDASRGIIRQILAFLRFHLVG